MVQIEPIRYKQFISWANRSPCNRVYPLSITEGRQSGAIYVDALETPRSVLFWHYCGFAYISGAVTESLLEEITADICHQSKRRMVLITDDAFAKDWLIRRGYRIADRIEYEYAGGGTRRVAHTKIDIQRIDEDNLHRITGRIVPAFSWEEERFLKDGFGYVVFERGAFCGAAFSAALCSKEVDIGVEVHPDYRQRGIATALVGRMCNEIVSQGKKPVWAHAAHNTGSMRTAARCGFVRKRINMYSCLKQGE
jgi:GNAT superfamily N-acetyltransferase